VPLAGEWPGTRVTGRNASRKAELAWLPVALGLTPHGLRHSERTRMENSRVHQVLAAAQMRHELKGIDVYRHVTEDMREELRGQAQAAWVEALQRRGGLSPGSPVRVLDRMLKRVAGGISARNPQERRVTLLSVKAKQATG
jgi:hypothetical protein